MTFYKKNSLIVLVLMVLASLPPTLAAYETYTQIEGDDTVTKHYYYPPVITERLSTTNGIRVQGKWTNGAASRAGFYDSDDNLLLETYSYHTGGTNTHYIINETGSTLCTLSNTGASDVHNADFQIRNNFDSTYDVYISNVYGNTLCSNLNLFYNDTVIYYYKVINLHSTYYQYADINTFQDTGFYFTGEYSGTKINFTSINNNSQSQATYGYMGYYNMTGQTANNYNFTFSTDGYITDNQILLWDGENSTNVTLNFFPAPSWNATFYDEQTNTPLTDVDFSLFFATSAYESGTGASSYKFVDINDTGMAEIEYNKTDYFVRRFYYNFTSGSYLDDRLYLLNETTPLAQEITFSVTDQSGVSLEGAIVKALRRYVEDGIVNYRVVSMQQSDSSGEGSLFLEKEIANYRFSVEYDGRTILLTDGSQIFQNSLILRGNTGDDVTTGYYDAIGLAYNLDYERLNFTTSWNSGSNLLNELCLTVYNYRTDSRPIINSSCSTDLTGSIVLGVPNSTSANYYATLTANVTDIDNLILLDDESVSLNNIATDIGLQGVFFTALLIIVGGTIALFNPAIGITLSLVTIIGATLIGIINLPIGVIMLLISSGLFMLFAFSRGGL
jgi:hypothetical protein